MRINKCNLNKKYLHKKNKLTNLEKNYNKPESQHMERYVNYKISIIKSELLKICKSETISLRRNRHKFRNNKTSSNSSS